MARDRDGAQLEQLLAERGSSLMAAAIALTGSRQDAEDLLQAALERVLRKPRRVVQTADVEGYLRRVLYNLAADWWRLARDLETEAAAHPARRDPKARRTRTRPPRSISETPWSGCSASCRRASAR